MADASERLDIDAIKAQLDIVDFASKLTKLRRVGAQWRGGCPCCEGKSKEPFLVDPGSSGAPHWKCFACDESGDVFNLHQIACKGTPNIPPSEFMAVVRDAAVTAGISLPDPPPRRVRSEHDRSKALQEEAWQAVVQVVRETPLPDDHPVELWPAEIRARVELGWYDAAAVDDRLTKLGVTNETRASAGLTASALQRLTTGEVFVRHGARQAIGLSQQQANGHWAHLIPPHTGGWRPLLLTDAPRGREEVRQVIVALSPARGAALAQALRDDAEPAGRRYAVVLGGPQQLDALLEPLTQRALILAPDEDSTTRAIYRTGAEFVARGFGLRVASGEATTPPYLNEALEFAQWQFNIMRSDVGMEPRTATAVAWVRDKILPLVHVSADPMAGAILEHRARALAAGTPVLATPVLGGVSA